MMKRRDFIKKMTLTLGSFSPLMRVAGGLGLLSSSSLASGFGDYKAIVIVSLDGGNDAMNMFPPTQAVAHATYSEIRTNLAVSLTDLYADEHYRVDSNGHFTATLGNEQPYYSVDSANPTSESNDIRMYTKGSYHTKTTSENTEVPTGLGINALMPEFASLYTKGKLSIVSNVGTLVEPTTKAQIDNGTANLPVFLFAHNHQHLAVGTTQAHTLGKTGWAGRLADSWQVNGTVGLNISFDKAERTLVGETTSPLTMSASGPGGYASITRSPVIEDLLLNLSEQTNHPNPFNRFYDLRNKSTAQLSTLLSTAWDMAPDFSTFSAKNSYGGNLFTGYTHNHKEKLGMLTHHGLVSRFLSQLKATAKMIKLSKDTLGHNRQIFYLQGYGYDTHSDQVHQHSRHIRTVSLGISDLYKALEEMGLDQDVLIVATSEFGRTLKTNGDGTDHGWGGHSFMLCGDNNFNGGNVFGEVMTDLSLDGVNAYTSRARMIPTTSIEQMLAPALKWFGVDDALMTTVLPNLVNFRTDAGDAESAFLQGVFT